MDITIRPETRSDYAEIDSMVRRSFSEGTDYSDGSDVVALIEEIRSSRFIFRNCQELFDNALCDINGYVVYDVYRNA